MNESINKQEEGGEEEGYKTGEKEEMSGDRYRYVAYISIERTSENQCVDVIFGHANTKEIVW